MASRVVRPETQTLQISGGDWLLVKKRLNHGERQEAFARRYISDIFGQRVNLALAGMDPVLAYLVDWSLTDLDGHVIPIRGKPYDERVTALNSIDGESFAEIRTAIEVHEAAMTSAREVEKNGQDGAKESSAISPSLASVAGDSTTSAL
jgi:hypothetical protein